MNLRTFKLDEARQLEASGQRPAGYVDDLLAIAQSVTEHQITIDADDPRLRELRIKYARHKADSQRAGHSPVTSLDKRAREPKKSRGLGDTIAKLTKAVGIKSCGGCKKRQEALNKLVPYKPSE